MNPVVIFDGRCALCHRSIRWLIHKDPQKKLRFVPRQSEWVKTLFKEAAITPPHSDSLWLYDAPYLYEYSDAVLHATRYLSAPWRFLFLARYIPKPLRDIVYRWVAKHRYRWFGQYTECPLPPPSWNDRFISPNEKITPGTSYL